MIADELLNPLLPALKPTDSVGKALDWMEEFRTNQLAVVESGRYLGLVNEEVLLETDDTTVVDDVQPQHSAVFAYDYQHLMEVLQLAQNHHLDLVPVLDEDRHFVGSITLHELLLKFAEQLGTQETGAVLVLNLQERDYSMAEISRLVEANETKIVSSYFSNVPLENDLSNADHTGRLTIKLNRRDVNAVVATLERFGYSVEAAFANEPLESADRERLDALFRYLDL
ncbi:MAG: CBS domain-containing protein [Cytophagaceae bacterium]|nr:CBS domain-containing protein [Cytophagaceae bacterium]